MNNDITSANATAILIVDDLYPAGFQLQMFGTDSAISQDATQISDTRIGLDGYMVAGYTPAIQNVTITLEAPSPSFPYLRHLWRSMQSNRKVYNCTLVCTIPSIYQVYTWRNGVLKEATPFPSVAQMLEPTTWLFHFGNISITGL